MDNEGLQNIKKDNIDHLLNQIKVNEHEVILWGVHVGFVAVLWLFVIACFRKNIDGDDLEKAFLYIMGESGVALASRVGYAVEWSSGRCLPGIFWPEALMRLPSKHINIR